MTTLQKHPSGLAGAAELSALMRGPLPHNSVDAYVDALQDLLRNPDLHSEVRQRTERKLSEALAHQIAKSD